MCLRTRRKIDGLSFMFKCMSITCIFLLLEGAFIVHRWTSSNKISTAELENLIPLEEGDYKYRRDKLFGKKIEPTVVYPTEHLLKKRNGVSPSCPVLQNGLLLFIRIPKCASTSFVNMLQSLSKTQRYEVKFDPSGAYNWNQKEIQAVVGHLQESKRPVVYARHFYYINFTKQGLSEYAYVTVIREPISRFVSSYLYYHFSSKPHIQRMLKPEHRNESLLQCIARRHNGCSHNMLTKYFCGHAPYCSSGSLKALGMAKENARKHFAVIGILERMETTMAVMKKVLPIYFSQASKSVFPTVNKNEHSKELTRAEEVEVRAANLADIELYNYCNRLLQEKASACLAT